MKYLMLLTLFYNTLNARPPHELTEIFRPVSPLPGDIQLHIRIIGLMQEQRKTKVNPQDPTLDAIMEVLKNAYALAHMVPGNSLMHQIIEDHDLRHAIKYLDEQEFKTKIL